MKMTAEEILDHVHDRLDHIVSKERWITMICKYLTTHELEQMLDMNELTPRFFEEQAVECDMCGQPTIEWYHPQDDEAMRLCCDCLDKEEAA